MIAFDLFDKLGQNECLLSALNMKHNFFSLYNNLTIESDNEIAFPWLSPGEFEYDVITRARSL